MSLEQRSRPAGNGPARNAEEQSKDSAPDPMALSPRDFQLAMAWYLSGLMAGIDRGREQEAREQADLWHNAFRTVRFFAEIPTHEELERRRRTYPDVSAAAHAAAEPAVNVETGEVAA